MSPDHVSLNMNFDWVLEWEESSKAPKVRRRESLEVFLAICTSLDMRNVQSLRLTSTDDIWDQEGWTQAFESFFKLESLQLDHYAPVALLRALHPHNSSSSFQAKKSKLVFLSALQTVSLYHIDLGHRSGSSTIAKHFVECLQERKKLGKELQKVVIRQSVDVLQRDITQLEKRVGALDWDGRRTRKEKGWRL